MNMQQFYAKLETALNKANIDAVEINIDEKELVVIHKIKNCKFLYELHFHPGEKEHHFDIDEFIVDGDDFTEHMSCSTIDCTGLNVTNAISYIVVQALIDFPEYFKRSN